MTELEQAIELLNKLSEPERDELLEKLVGIGKPEEQGKEEYLTEKRFADGVKCPHCRGTHIQRNGRARGWQQYRCVGQEILLRDDEHGNLMHEASAGKVEEVHRVHNGEPFGEEMRRGVRDKSEHCVPVAAQDTRRAPGDGCDSKIERNRGGRRNFFPALVQGEPRITRRKDCKASRKRNP